MSPLLALLLACSPDCADAACGAPADAGPGEAAGDTAEPGIAASCEVAAASAPDPLARLGDLDVQDHVFAELVDVGLAGDLALAAGQGGLVVVDVSDPAAPAFLSAGFLAEGEQRFHHVEPGPDGVAWATHRDYGLVAFDLSDPSRPEPTPWTGHADLAGMAWPGGDRLYAVTHAGEIVVFDVSDPLAPAEVARAGGLGHAWEALSLGDRLYVADNSEGVVVVDVSEPDAPRVVAAVEAAGGVQDVAASADGSTLYAAAGSAGVEVFALDDPDAPLSVARVELGGSVQSVAVDGDLLWAVDQQEVFALDVSDPRDPRPLNGEATPQWAMHVAAGGGLAWVADWGHLESYALDADVEAPDARPASTRVHLAEDGGSIDVSIANIGAAPLRILGLDADVPGLEVSAGAAEIAPGGSGAVTIAWPGGALEEAVVCIATDDPDEPVIEVEVVGSSGDGPVGQPAPDFELQDLDGEWHRLSDQLGHPVVLVYFATW